MAHVFRAVWIDDYLNVELVALESFGAWLRGRNTPIEIVEGSQESVGPRSVSAVRHRSGDDTGIQIQLVESLGPERGRWITTLSGMTVEGRKIVWVDVQAEATKVWERAIRAPRIVREMLLAGGEPRVGEDVLEAQPREIDDDIVLARLVDRLLHEDRKLPYLVLAGGEGHDHHSAMQRATRASEILAGVAKVAMVDYAFIGTFNASLPNGLSLEPMSARLFMPQPQRNPDDVRLTTSFSDEEVSENQTDLGLRVAMQIGISSLWPDVPEEWKRFKRHLDERRREVHRSHVAEKHAETVIPAAATDTNFDELTVLRQVVEDLQNQLLDAAISAEEAQIQAHNATERLVHHLVNDADDVSFRRPTLAATIEEVRQLSKWVVIPESAPREVASLDTNAAAGAWANDLGRLLASMERYAKAKSEGRFQGNYRAWCTKHGDYSDDKIALNESLPNRQDPKLRRARTFAVDHAVDPSGEMLMVNHAKVQARGTSIIPRVYFHDDTAGVTRKIHIGFIGPHYLVPTSTF